MKKGTLGHMIHMARFEKGMSQKTLAALIRVDPSYISSLEKGKTTPSEEVLKRIAEALDLSFLELFNLNTGASFSVAKVVQLKLEEQKVIAVLNSLLDERVLQDQLEAVTLYLGPSHYSPNDEERFELQLYRVKNHWLMVDCHPNSKRGKRFRMIAKDTPELQRQNGAHEPDSVKEEEDQ